MRGKDEEKVIIPMFPRLHVNDTEKGGPRAPPRNKMALYEQLSIPSPRFSPGLASMLLPPKNGNNSVPSMSSSHGVVHERNEFTPFGNSPAPSDLSERLHSYSSGGVKLNTMMASQVQKSMKPASYQNLNATGPLSSTAKCSSFQPYSFSNFKNFSLKRLGDVDDYRDPTSAHPGKASHCSDNQHGKDMENGPRLKLNSSMHLQTTCEKQKKGIGAIDLKSRQYVRNQDEDNAKVSQTSQDHVESSASIPSTREKFLDASSSPSIKAKNSKSLKRPDASLNKENKSNSVKIFNSLHGTNARSHQDCVAVPDDMALRENILIEPTRGVGKESAPKVRSESCLRPSVIDINISPNELENGSECGEDKNCGSIQVREPEIHDDVLDTSMVDSISVLNVSTNDVVGVIGDKQFEKARRAIVKQQRVFAVQVFELHRLIKVQRLIAGSPHLLLEDNLLMGKPSLYVSPLKKLPSEYVLEPPPIVKPKDHSQKPNTDIECEDENAVPKLSLPSVNNDTSKGFVTRSSYGPCLGNEPPTPVTTNTKLSPWCFAPPVNQWLVPVMSPSEGLVYKPYTGRCPPTTGFMAPGYGSSGPMSLTPWGGDFLNATDGIPASHQQGIGILPGTRPLGQTYFPPYSMPFMNPSISGSAVEQVSPFAGVQSKGNQLSMGDINITIPHQSSYNLSSQMIEMISGVGKFQAWTENSPSDRAKGDELPLFPMEPTVSSDQNAQTGEQRPQVIKVLPHNPGSATESAARIFQSIQEERKQYDQILI